MKSTKLPQNLAAIGAPTSETVPSRRLNMYARKDDRRSRALALGQELSAFKRRDEYSQFSPLIEKLIRLIRREGSRTFEQDAALVINSLKSGATEIDEICEDAELSRADVTALMEVLLARGTVTMEKQARAANGRGAKRTLYYLADAHS